MTRKEWKNLINFSLMFVQQNGGKYVDDVVKIQIYDKGGVEIRRMKNNNPVAIMRPNGEIIRIHGEFTHIAKHLDALISRDKDILDKDGNFVYPDNGSV